MKKKIFLLATISLVCFLSTISNAQTPDWLWATNPAGSSDDFARFVTVDSYGNTYVVGAFNSPTLTFGSTVLTTSSYGYYSAFLAKYDADGNALWAKNVHGISQANSVAVDANGNIYITGYFSEYYVYFGSIQLTNSNSSNNTQDMFLAKYDTNGNVIWAKKAGGALHDAGNSVVIDALGNILIAGYCTSSNGRVFLAKYDSSGNELWTKSAGSTYGSYATSIAVDNSGDFFVTGNFTGYTIVFDGISFNNPNGSNLYGDIFIAKYNANGDLLWVKIEGGTKADNAYGISTDNLGNAYITGSFDSPTLNFGSTTLTNSSGGTFNNIFITKYDASGNVVWANVAGGTNEDIPTAIAVDSSGNAYITGNFKSPSLNFGSTTLTNEGVKDIFLTKYDNAGNVSWAKSVGGTTEDISNAVALDISGNIYIAGTFTNGDLDFGSISLNYNGVYDIFLAKYGLPAAPMASSNGTLCAGSTLFLSASTIVGATYYWTGPNGFTSNQQNPTVSANATTAMGGTYNVVATVNTITGPAGSTTVVINPLPASAGTITGTTTVCQGENSVTYTVPTIADATSYLWTLPTGATGASTTNSITVDYGIAAVSGNIAVKGHNTCGDGAISTIAVTVNPIPASAVITQNSNVLTSSSVSGNQWYNSTNQIVGANAQTYTITSNDDYFVIVTINGCSSDTSNVIQIIGTTINDIENNLISVYPNPVVHELTIESNSSIKYKFEIVNVTGQILYSSILETKSIIDMSVYSSGIYTLKINTEKSTILKKIVKQ